MLDHLDAGVVAHRLERRDERAGDLGAGGVAAGVRDAVAVVAALAGQRDLAGGVRSKCAPSATRSRTRRGPSVTSARTASSSHSPAPATSVSREVLGR